MKFQHRLAQGVAQVTLLACGAAFAQAKTEITFAHQDMLVPRRTVMESGELEKAC
jgi:taurine transport system substrate-binding protein